MPILEKKNEDGEKEPWTVEIIKVWVELDDKERYLVSQSVAEYIERLEDKVEGLAREL
ncbi:MAG: hypothetical protein ACI9AT_000437 [Ulvibacter sp.]|jgi:hypothetical protein